MENNRKDIRDDEFRVLGTGVPVQMEDPSEARRRKRQGGWVALAILAVLGLAMILFWPKKETVAEGDEAVEGVFEQSYESDSVKPLGEDDVVKPYAERMDTTVAGHPLRIFIPHHATPRLRVGQPDEETLQAVMGFQAADIRADNYEILGDFVLAGQQLTRGASKRGFCAIVDGKVTVGVAEETPLLQAAIDRGGYFFRQYPLVDNGAPIVNKPKNTTVRKALCDRGGQVVVVFSSDDQTFGEFAQTLVELGVDNAIYLVGSEASFGWTNDADGNRTRYGNIDHRPEYRNENYILWTSK